MKKLILVLSLPLILFSVSVQAEENTEADKLAITEVIVTEEVPSAEEYWGFMPQAEEPAPIPEDEFQGIDWDKIVRIGRELIEIIKANQPVVNIKRDTVAAIPAGISDWQVLAGWQVPVTRVFRVWMKNAYGMTMVDIRLKASAMYGGNYQDRGRYLANVIIVPTQVVVHWGVTLDIWSEVREPVNVGSMAQPVAGLGFDLRYRAKTMMSEINGAQDYFITGNGDMHVMQ